MLLSAPMGAMTGVRMRNLVCLSVAALVLLAVPASAQDCVVPYAPTVPSGTTATREQILAARDEVTAFLKASEDYQMCLTTHLEQRLDEARRYPRDNPPQAVETLKKATANKINASKRELGRTGDEINAAIRAFNEAHPAAN
jgi:hypothetical protein